MSEPAGRRDLSALPAFLRGDSVRRPVVVQAFRVRAPIVAPQPDAASLPMVGISPRRLVLAVAVLVLVWAVMSFSRQVTAATAASSHAAELRAASATLTDEVAAMQRELVLVQEARYIDQQARAFRLGTTKEIPFALAGSAPVLPPDAPGSAALRLGAEPGAGSPLDAWLQVLFGPGG